MSFLSIATPFVELGIPVFPLTPMTKIPPSGFHFLEEATIDPARVALWNDENPDYNVALLANGEFCFLSSMSPKACPPLLPRWRTTTLISTLAI